MPKPSARPHSRYSQTALALLGRLIRAARIQRKMTAQELADRAGVSRGLVQRIEKGDPRCAIGAAFEAATIVGVPLFEADTNTISRQLRETQEKLALLPKSVRKSEKVADDDF